MRRWQPKPSPVRSLQAWRCIPVTVLPSKKQRRVAAQTQPVRAMQVQNGYLC